MNCSYHLAPERAPGRPGMGRPMLAPLALLLGALLAPAAEPAALLPGGERVVSGQADIRRSDHQLTIIQTSPKAIVHWQSFDIGRGASVRFEQPDANAVALNRVMGSTPSRIDGQLGANGQVWLVNPNGVVFGRGSQVNVGGLVASTLDITDADFHAGERTFTRGGATGGITNQGDITVADRGTLALLATTVKNEGVIKTRWGNMVLAGGDKVLLYADDSGLLQVAVDPATVRTLIENRHLIVADGSHVLMTSNAADALSASVVSNAGTVQARTLENRRGSIVLHGAMQHGTVENSGLLDASAPDGGPGGSIETNAAVVRISADARVTTAAPQGATGHWQSHSAADLALHAGSAPEGSAIAADMLTASLAQTHVVLHVHAPGDEQPSIHVNAGIRHDRNLLALDAGHDIDIDAPISVAGSGTLQLNHGGTRGRPDATPAPDSNLHVVPGKGRVDFERSGARLLRINGHGYTVIGDMAALQAMGDADRLGGKYALGRSLDARGVNFRPIGADARKTFSGAFDGLGHTIRNLAIYRQEQPAGLFGDATNATLRNLHLEQMDVQGGHYVGGLVGRHRAAGGSSAISNVHVDAQVSGGFWVGALVGAAIAQDGGASRISHAHGAGQVQGHSFVGGLVGEHKSVGSRARIDHASSAAAVVGRNAHIGGLVGSNEARSCGSVASIADAHATGLVFGYSHVGGLVGRNTSHTGRAPVSSASASGQVSGREYSGGLVGRNLAAIGGAAPISHASAAGDVSGGKAVGGLVGANAPDPHSTASVSHARSMGDVSGHAEVGTLIGSNLGMAPAMSAATGKVKGPAFCTGAIGGHGHTGAMSRDFSMPSASAANPPQEE